MGALWTPGYWGFYGGRYSFYPGHWGLHIGFYGGINYGFGYVGFGYEGGYWNSGHFFYNSVYNHLNARVVHNVYSYNAGNRGQSAVLPHQLQWRIARRSGSASAIGSGRVARTDCSAHEHAGAARAELLHGSRTACDPESRKACHASHQPAASGRPQREAFNESRRRAAER